MRTLKNWTITAKAIKHGQNGILNYNAYLTDKSRHKGQDLTVLNNDKALTELLKIHSDFEIQKKTEQKRHKGGRTSNVGWSSVLSYPFDITPKNFEILTKQILLDFYNYVNNEEKLNMNNEDINELVNMSIRIIHNGKNVNNHVHMILSKQMYKRTRNLLGKQSKKLVSIDLTKKKYLYNLKLINDNAVEKILGVNKEEYNIIKHTEKPQKKRKTKIQIKLDELNKKENDLNKRETEIIKLESIYAEIAQKHKIMTETIEERKKALNIKENGLNDRIKELKIYTEKQFEKDMALHTKYMTKGMTEKAEKLKSKIESKINKTTNNHLGR